MTMYNHELTLIKNGYTEDELGNQIPSDEETTILCKLKSVSRNEFYNASIANLKPEKVFIVHGYEYNNETLIEFEGEKYTVIRTYANDFEEIELVCERKVGNG